MRSLILVGDKDTSFEFVEKYLKDNHILPYNIYRFNETLKIADAREIKNFFSKKSVNGGKRAVIIEADPTVESQNALLKTLEEIPEDSSIIFCSAANLLPTIFSRCTVINVGSNTQAQASEELNIKFSDLYELLLLIDKSFSAKNENNYENYILSLRFALLSQIQKQKNDNVVLIYKVLKELVNNLPQVVSNNLNQRVAAERSVIKVFC